jgi:hypothetical protein
VLSQPRYLFPPIPFTQNKYYVEHKALPTLQEAATRAFKDVVFGVLKVSAGRVFCGVRRHRACVV